MNKAFFILASLAVPAAALAASPLQIVSSVMVEQRVAARDGTTSLRFVAPARVVPGDRVMLVLAYRNTGGQPLTDVVLANPVPSGMTYRGPADGSPAPDLSVNGTTFGPLASLKVPTSGGGARPATAADVTAVRWRLRTPIAAGAGGRLAFHAVVK